METSFSPESEITWTKCFEDLNWSALIVEIVVIPGFELADISAKLVSNFIFSVLGSIKVDPTEAVFLNPITYSFPTNEVAAIPVFKVKFKSRLPEE